MILGKRPSLINEQALISDADHGKRILSDEYALISVYDKTGLETIVGALARRLIGIIASGRTAEAIRKMGIQATDVTEYTGSPEMPGGLVKTLHPKIHAGILGDWNVPEQRQYLDQQRVHPLSFVIVNLYPFQDVIKKDSSNFRKAVDNIDIGGVALIRAAGKGALLNNRVVPVTSPKYYPTIERELSVKGRIGTELRAELVNEAFKVTSAYDTAIHDYFVNYKRRS